jgi:hypothetical protein
MEKITFKEYTKIAKEGDSVNIYSNDGSNDIYDNATFYLMDKTLKRYWFKDKRGEFYGDLVSCRNWEIEILYTLGKNLKVIKTGKKLYGDIVINKNKEQISIFIKLPKEIEEWYKSVNGGLKETSNAWLDKNGVGVEFYKISQEVREKERTVHYEVFSDFGKGFLNEDNRINLAILRTVGITDGIEIFSKNFKSIDNAQQEYYVKKLTEYIKKFWEREISENTLKVRMTFEF